MKKDKKKSKKKKSGGKSRSEWDQDGGVIINDSNTDNNEEKRKYRINTQEKDDRNRRISSLRLDRKRKQEFVNKMGKKIKFSDVLVDSDAEEPRVLLEQNAVTKRQRNQSSKSVYDRLNSFVRSTIEEELNDYELADGDSDDVSNEDEEDENEDDEEEDEEEMPKNDKLKSSKRSSLTVDEDNDSNDEDSSEEAHKSNFDEEDGDIDDEDNQDAVTDNYSWMFQNYEDNADDTSNDQYKLVKSFDEFSIYSKLDSSINLPPSIRHYRDIPGLYKLWKTRAAEKVVGISREMLPLLLSYADIFIDGRTHMNDCDILQSVLMHISVHIVRSRVKQIKHDQKLKAVKAEEKINKVKNSSKKPKSKEKFTVPTVIAPANITYQDQGYCRPRVLILCPFRHSCKQIVELLVTILGSNTTVANMDKFDDEYGPGSDEEDDEYDKGLKKPEDWRSIFKDNMDDDFKLGIKIHPGQGKGVGADKGVKLRLYSDFYQSDIIIASPLGLRLVVDGSKGKLNFDFLSSLEVVYLHQADVLFMQNWDHVEYILKNINKLPQSDHEIDFSRVRPYFLEGNGNKHKQVIINSAFNEPLIQAAFRDHAKSVAGIIKVKKDWNDGNITQVGSKINQVFTLLKTPSFSDNEDVRFQYFRDNILSKLLATSQTRTLIVTPSYISYVRVRNEMIKRDANAAYVCEYSRDSEISRGRSRFYQGINHLMLYSGRSHFFNRYKIRGAMHLIFYSLPEYAHYYPEIVNVIGDIPSDAKNNANNNVTSCTVLFTQFEKMALERLVGKQRCDHIFASDKTTFMFC